MNAFLDMFENNSSELIKYSAESMSTPLSFSDEGFSPINIKFDGEIIPEYTEDNNVFNFEHMKQRDEQYMILETIPSLGLNVMTRQEPQYKNERKNELRKKKRAIVAKSTLSTQIGSESCSAYSEEEHNLEFSSKVINFPDLLSLVSSTRSSGKDLANQTLCVLSSSKSINYKALGAVDSLRNALFSLHTQHTAKQIKRRYIKHHSSFKKQASY